MPINITNPHSDLWAIIAAVAAILTLGAVAKQIGLARQELQVVKDDLAQNRRLIDDAFRRPNLYATFTQSHGRYADARGSYLGNTISARIYNSGDRPSTLVKLELLVPSALLIDADSLAAITRDVTGVLYAVIELGNMWPDDGTKVLFPNAVPLRARGAFRTTFPATVEGFVCLWRVYDEYGVYPKPSEGGPGLRDGYGRVRATAEWLQDGNPVDMEPA
ncbi:MAG TPA: hypothetical protein VJP76_00270 [Candidatus Tumulicola sp.]|nr:hypothetical protein [Candidatus Tumulicola sp.]